MRINGSRFVEVDRDGEKFKRAVAAARRRKPYVSAVQGERDAFSVKGKRSSHCYTVHFLKLTDGRLVAECFDEEGNDCMGFRYNAMCYHIASAAGFLTGVEQMRVLAAESEEPGRATLKPARGKAAKEVPAAREPAPHVLIEGDRHAVMLA
jgi:hypothetical protein